MPIDLWSRREGLLKPAELLYAEAGSRNFPETFRVRVCRWAADLVQDVHSVTEGFWYELMSDLCDAYGRSPLVSLKRFGPVVSDLDYTPLRQVGKHIQVAPDLEALDFIDALYQKLAPLEEEYTAPRIFERLELSVDVLNTIMAEEGVGYRWTSGKLIRFDAGFTHEEAIAPALELLAGGRFGAANQEFGEALDEYRAGHYRDAITKANAAFESVMKIVTGKTSGTAADLIREVKAKGVIPPYLGTSADHLVKLLNAVPAARGQQSSAHGRGGADDKADQQLARLVLTAAAAFMVYIGEQATDS